MNLYVCIGNLCIDTVSMCMLVYVYMLLSYTNCLLLCGFRCGLAEQLDRLLSQQRSEKTLWYHQVFRQHDHQGDNHYCKNSKFVFSTVIPANSLGVKLISLVASYSVFIAQAHVIQESGCSTHPLNGEVVTILFDAETVKVLKLQSSSCVFICPPWYECVCVCVL